MAYTTSPTAYLTNQLTYLYWKRLDHFVRLITLKHAAYYSAAAEPLSIEDAFTLMALSDVRYPDICEAWQNTETDDRDLFCTAIEIVTGSCINFCADCDEPMFSDDGTYINDHGTVCESCRDSYAYCESCEEYVGQYDTNSIGGSEWCESCTDRYCGWCEQCEEYYVIDDGGHDHGCDCDVPRPRFFFPANGAGTIAQNERLAVELPAGMVSDVGMQEITYHLIRQVGALVGDDADYQRQYEVRVGIHKIMDELDPQWQKKDGNLTRRLSKALYKSLNVKIPPALLSEIGNLARQHTNEAKEFHVEVTRDLNGSAYEFGHEDSCWWGGYAYSRCSLKNWGGIGLRSYDNERQERHDPSGRAWVQPLDVNLQPTHDTLGAHAYVVYNGYGNLAGYAPARIIAHLTGKTYRKIVLNIDRQYVNGETGYLVSDEATCSSTNDVGFGADEHDTFDHKTLEVAA